MADIKKIAKCVFDSHDYALRIGEDASYNTYYAISLNYKNELLNLGLQMPDTGIAPQITVINSHIVIGANEDVFIWKPDMREPIHYELHAPFYQFFVVSDNIIIVHELGVIALNKSFNKKWEKSFSEIIDIEEINDKILILKDYTGNTIKLNVMTGERI